MFQLEASAKLTKKRKETDLAPGKSPVFALFKKCSQRIMNAFNLAPSEAGTKLTNELMSIVDSVSKAQIPILNDK